MTMTSRERVQAVLHYEIPDRVPIIIGVSNATGIKIKPYRGIKKILGIESEDRYLYDWPELGSALPDETVMERLRSDVRGVLDRFPKDVYDRNQSRPPHSPFIDDWGNGQMEIGPDNWYPGVHPLPDAKTVEELDYFPWPNMDDSFRTVHVRDQALKIHQENQYAILATPWLMFPFERAIGLQGMEKFLFNMASDQDFAQEMLKRINKLCMTNMGHFLDQCGDVIDIIKIGDDLGTQENLMISPRMYRKMLKPLHAEMIALIKQKTKAKVFFHTDGDVFNLVEDFIEIGVDILNPIQTSAGKMSNLEELKKQYDKRIVFCGAIDTQKILPHGSPEEVKQEVRRVINILGQGGGYMLATVHTVMNEVSAENVLAMVDAVEEYGYYPLKA
ncbi:MAG: uroporphyrinogen decarboxylase family protein [Anaerolineaceae bacterium]|nr:uroporphyrinogen decarboxylase family protein [Anaerolineaceae bacterium]